MCFLKLIIIVSGILMVNSELNEMEETFLSLYVKIEKLQKSIELLNMKVDMMEKCHQSNAPTSLPSPTFEEIQQNRNHIRPIYDARIDSLPAHCQSQEDLRPSNCAQACRCTQTSGYYNITVSRYRNHTFLAMCDYRSHGGDWLHILQRNDGSENFTRPWLDYVNGFGQVDGEYWIGLENLYALTNHDGPQELFVYMEDLNGKARFARYDHFVIGDVSENYKLKTLGKYSGNTGDGFEYARGAEFSTYDADRDTNQIINCARKHQTGWWYKKCTQAAPLGFYYEGEFYNDIYWREVDEVSKTIKFFVMMIRRQRIFTD